MERLPLALSIAALVCFAALAAGNLVATSPTYDEVPHLTAGYTYLRARDFRMNPEHPPLVKTLAAAPLLVMDLWPEARAGQGQRAMEEWRKSWSHLFVNPPEQWRLGWLWLYGRKDAALAAPEADPVASGPERAYAPDDFLNDSRTLFAVARIPVLLLGLAGGVFVFLWSRQLWGAWGAAISTMLFAFDPSFLAHSTVVTTDVAIAACTVATLYFFWRVSQRWTAGSAVGFVIAFSLAQIAKFTGLLLVPVVMALALWHLVRHRRTGSRMLALVAVAGVASILVLWGAYGFRFAAAADGSGGFFTENVVREWQAHEDIRRLGPDATEEQQLWARRNATIGGAKSLVLVAKRYRLLPEAYLHGVAFAGASTVLRTAFLNGEFSNFGFLTYFFWTFLYKTPIPAIVAVAAGLFFALRSRPAGIEFLLVPAAILLAVAVLSRFNIGHRHILVVMPLLYILCGSLAAVWERRRAVWIPAAGALLALSSSIVFAGRPAVMPGNHMAYLNEFAGGPRRGYVRLNDSNFDWGQDLARLGRWVGEHGVTEPIQLAYFGTADARVYGIRFRPASPAAPLRPGYLAISTVEYIGLYAPPATRDRWPRALERANAQLVDTAGYSILIFNVP